MKMIKLMVFDVDGVLTDGKLYIGSNGEEYKAFHTQDGMGISLAHYTGMKTAIITGRKSDAVQKRADELNIHFVYQGIHHKLEVLKEIVNELNIGLDEVCYMGDDINDIPILNVVGFSACPQNAVKLVREKVMFISNQNGGQGAVREVIDYILENTYDYHALIDDYVNGKIFVAQ